MDSPPVRLISPFAALLGFEVVERADGRSVVECQVVDKHINTQGLVHGGVVTSLIDMACGVSVAFAPSYGGRAAVTVSLTVNFMLPGQRGDRLRAVGARRGKGKRIVASECEVTNQAGDLVAMGIATLRILG